MENFAEKRLKICKNCAISKIDDEWGLQCDSRKYINPTTNEASWFKKEGWVKGCGCILQYRCANINNHCVAGKW